MNSEWQRTFRNRMNDFEAGHKVPVGAVPVSIKVRVSSVVTTASILHTPIPSLIGT